jgi:DNA helicase-2/ATP-dependent DNA helicase PcrA
LFGNSLANPPSRFLKDISPHLVTARRLWEEENLSLLPATVYSQPLTHSLGNTDLRVGDWVRHSKFGDGVVMDCSSDKGDRVVAVSFREAGVKKLLLSLAPLQRIEKDQDFPA